MFFAFRSFIRSAVRTTNRPLSRPRCRPSLEVLEGRAVYAALTGAMPALMEPPTAAAQMALQSSPGRESLVFTTEVVARDLSSPTGIFVRDGIAYVTLVPTPGVGGGQNAVEMIDFETGARRVLHMGEPEPTNIVRGRDGTLYWTCTSAGVILSQTPEQALTNEVSVVRGGLDHPVGIALSANGRHLYWSEVPTRGASGGEASTIHRLDLRSGREVVLYRGNADIADLAVGRNGTVYFTDRSGGEIVEVNARGRSRVLVSGLASPEGLAMDKHGRNLYFTEVPTPAVSGANGGMNTVNMLNLRTLERTIINAGDPEPTDLWVDHDGAVYWTCTSAGVIVKATPARRR